MAKINVDKIELKNFFSYGNQWQSVDLREGVNIVLGHDKDKDRSNGAGKTSFLEAIPFALFGQTSKGVSLPKIINWKNGKQCEVKLHFRKDGHSYMIHRGIKPGIIELVKDGTPVPKLSDKRVFQMELENDLIGMDFKAAQALLFQNANNMVSIFNTPKAEKRKFIEKFFNLEIYSKMTEHTNRKLQNVIKRLAEIGMEIDFKVRRIGELEKSIGDCCVPDMEAYQHKVDDAMGALGQFTADHLTEFNERPQLEDEMTELRGQRGVLKGDEREIMIELGKVEDELNLLAGEIKALKRRNDTIGDLSAQRDELEKFKETLTKLDHIESGIEEVDELIKHYTGIMDEAGHMMTIYTTEKKQAMKEKTKWSNHSQIDDPTCPTCFQQTDPEHIKTHVEACLVEAELTLTGISERNDVQETIYSDAKNEHTKVSEKRSKLVQLLEKKRQIEQKIATLSGVEEKQQELDDNNTRIAEIEGDLVPALEAQHDEIQGRIDVVSSDINAIQTAIEEKQVLYDEFKDLQRQHDKLATDLETETKIYASQREIHDRLIKEHEANIASKTELEAEVSEFDAEIKKLETMKDYLEYIKTTLKDENVKQYAIGNIIPFLQQQTNHYLAETGHNYYVELDSWLDGTINGYGVGDCDFGNMSGGEGKSIDLALKFAMMDVARRQAGSYLDVLVLDELLDSSIDSHGIEKTFEIVRTKQQEDNLKVFIVSHREEIADFGVDGTYRVTKEDGFSTLDVL